MGCPALFPSGPFLCSVPSCKRPQADPNTSTPQVATGQGSAVTVTTRNLGEQAWAAPGSTGIWRGLGWRCLGQGSADLAPGAGSAEGGQPGGKAGQSDRPGLGPSGVGRPWEQRLEVGKARSAEGSVDFVPGNLSEGWGPNLSRGLRALALNHALFGARVTCFVGPWHPSPLDCAPAAS